MRLLLNAEVELVVVIDHVDEAGRLRVSGEVYRLSVRVSVRVSVRFAPFSHSTAFLTATLTRIPLNDPLTRFLLFLRLYDEYVTMMGSSVTVAERWGENVPLNVAQGPA